jgi:hypothetical protein
LADNTVWPPKAEYEGVRVEFWVSAINLQKTVWLEGHRIVVQTQNSTRTPSYSALGVVSAQAGFWQTTQYGSVLQSLNCTGWLITPGWNSGFTSTSAPSSTGLLILNTDRAAHEKLILSVEQEHPWEQGDGSELQNIRC